jgi:hypothetical protein
MIIRDLQGKKEWTNASSIALRRVDLPPLRPSVIACRTDSNCRTALAA